MRNSVLNVLVYVRRQVTEINCIDDVVFLDVAAYFGHFGRIGDGQMPIQDGLGAILRSIRSNEDGM